MFSKALCVLFLFIGLIPIQSQCFKENIAFQAGENLKYDVYYNLGFVWINGGEVKFEVKEKRYNHRDVYFLNSYGNSREKYDWIFKVRDHYISYLDKETLLPISSESKIHEGSLRANNTVRFNHEKNLIYTFVSSNKKPTRYDTLKYRNCTFDLLSLVYYTRNINFDTIPQGGYVKLKTILEGDFITFDVHVLGKEEITTKNNETYRCVKYRAQLVEGTIFKAGEDITAWVTDDDNKIPVLIEADIAIGRILTYLNSAEGVKNPFR
jgi:hypothetical protein